MTKTEREFRQLKLSLVEQALQSNYTRKRLHRVTVTQLVNRVLLLFQRPRIFLFYHKEANQWRNIFGTYQDVLFETTFQRTVMGIIHKERKGELYYVQPPESLGTKHQWREAPSPIGGTGFGLLLVSAEQRTQSGQVKFAPASEEEYSLLEELWGSFLGCQYSRVIGVEERLKSRLLRISNDPDAKTKAVPEITDDMCRLKEGDRNIIDAQIDLLTEITEQLYHDLYATALVCNKGKVPPNLYFFLRYYDDSDTINRFENGLKGNRSRPYPYSLRLIIPRTQREHLVDMLRNINKSKQPDEVAKKGRWVYRQRSRIEGFNEVFPTEPRQVEYARFPTEELDGVFWDMIRAKAYDQIIEEVITPFGKGARSLVDPVLMSGCTHYRPGIYTHAGKERVHQQVTDPNSMDARRLVYMHYLLSASAPSSNKDTLGFMSVPLFVGTHAYMAVGQAIISGDDEVEREAWPRNFHFFTDIGRHCVRRLRYRTKSVYKAQIREQLYKAVETFVNRRQSGNWLNFREIESEANRRFSALCRVWPYSLVSINISYKPVKNLGEHDIPFFSYAQRDDLLVLRFEQKPNPYFDAGKVTQPDVLDERVALSTQELKTLLEASLSGVYWTLWNRKAINEGKAE